MFSVTQQIKNTKQPKGGYIKPSDFVSTVLEDDEILLAENLNPSIVGMAVDYLTRLMLGSPVEKAFEFSIKGYKNASSYIPDAISTGEFYLENIKDLDNRSIMAACLLVQFDVWYRNPYEAMQYGFSQKEPDLDTIENIRIMVNRSLRFFEKYGPVTADGFTFEPAPGCKNKYGGYSSVVSAGDGDFLTEDTLWDFKVSKKGPTPLQTLQIATYWVMGQHSGQERFKNISKIGIFNPRLNIVYQLDVSKIASEVIKEIEDYVLCYYVDD